MNVPFFAQDWWEELMMRTKLARWIALTFVLFGIICASIWVGLNIWKPNPSGKLVIATGGSENAYHEYAGQLKAELAKRGIEVELRPAMEGIDTLKAMFADDSVIDAGFVKGGFASTLQGRLATAKARDWHDKNLPKVRSVGRLFYEPLWVFVRPELKVTTLRDLKGKRILVGTKASGTRRIALQFLKANGLYPSKEAKDGEPAVEGNITAIEDSIAADGGALAKDDVDAAFLILPPESPKVQALLRNPNLKLMSFGEEADAYVTRFPSLTKVVLHQGAIELDPKIPKAETVLLTTSTALVVRDDLHPALVSLLTHAVIRAPKSGFDKDGEPILFHKGGEFPNGSDPEYELAPEARNIYKTGELPYLLGKAVPVAQQLRLPFGVAAFADAHGAQSALLLIPALTILYPLFKLLPILYTWSVRQRLLYWYRQLKGVEADLDRPHSAEEIAVQLAEVEKIDRVVRRIRVPLHFTDQLYDLRAHIDLVRRRLMEETGPLRQAAE